MLKKFWDWIRKSSVDPKATSLTVKSFLLGLIPAVLHIVTIACGFGIICLGVNSEGLNELVQTITNVVFYLLGAIAGIGFIVGFIRKLYMTATGQNKAV